MACILLNSIIPKIRNYRGGYARTCWSQEKDVTKRTNYYRLFIACILLVCTGCWPYHFTHRPGAAGTVVDAENKAPIVGASVKLTRFGSKENKDAAAMITQADGRFLIKPEQEWSIYIVPMDYFPMKAVITITSQGYFDLDKEFRWSMVGPSMTDLGLVEMQRKKQD